MTLNDPKVTIAFLGQCHTVGYHGVPPEASFPQICREVVESRRPGTRVDVVVREYQHPSELPNTASAAMLTRPRVVVIEVVGWLTIRGRESVDLSRLPRGVRSAYQRVRYLRRVSQALLASVPRMTDRKFAVPDNAQKLLGAIVPRQLRAGVAEYEVCIQRAITQVKSVPGTYCVVQGPGAPNLALNARSLASDALERYRAVEAMARRVAAANDALYVDRWDTVTPSFFAPRSIRPTPQGHLMWGHLLADNLIKAGIV